MEVVFEEQSRVVRIERSAFHGAPLKSIAIPQSVEVIGEESFWHLNRESNGLGEPHFLGIRSIPSSFRFRLNSSKAAMHFRGIQNSHSNRIRDFLCAMEC
jgi:hypothetical protein